jgi:hypothetical protein
MLLKTTTYLLVTRARCHQVPSPSDRGFLPLPELQEERAPQRHEHCKRNRGVVIKEITGLDIDALIGVVPVGTLSVAQRTHCEVVVRVTRLFPARQDNEKQCLLIFICFETYTNTFTNVLLSVSILITIPYATTFELMVITPYKKTIKPTIEAGIRQYV